MSEEQVHCVQCDAPLKTPDSVCTFCEEQLANEAKTELLTGRYVCPACNLKFSKPEQLPYPATAKWYQPQSPKACCPHCKCFFSSKYLKFYKTAFALLYSLSFLRGVYGLPNIYFFTGFFAVNAVLLAILGVIWYREFKNPDRYILDKRI
jgi:hypothetical protein